MQIPWQVVSEIGYVAIGALIRSEVSAYFGHKERKSQGKKIDRILDVIEPKG